MENILDQLFYCKVLNAKITPITCKQRKNISKRIKEGLATRAEKFAIGYAFIDQELIKKCAMCERGK